MRELKERTIPSSQSKAPEGYIAPLPAWMRDAACSSIGPEIFYDVTTTHLAKKVCASCPVILDCRKYGEREEFGVWGGRTANQRLQDYSLQRFCFKGHRKSTGTVGCAECRESQP